MQEDRNAPIQDETPEVPDVEPRPPLAGESPEPPVAEPPGQPGAAVTAGAFFRRTRPFPRCLVSGVVSLPFGVYALDLLSQPPFDALATALCLAVWLPFFASFWTALVWCVFGERVGLRIDAAALVLSEAEPFGLHDTRYEWERVQALTVRPDAVLLQYVGRFVPVWLRGLRPDPETAARAVEAYYRSLAVEVSSSAQEGIPAGEPSAPPEP